MKLITRKCFSGVALFATIATFLGCAGVSSVIYGIESDKKIRRDIKEIEEYNQKYSYVPDFCEITFFTQIPQKFINGTSRFMWAGYSLSDPDKKVISNYYYNITGNINTKIEELKNINTSVNKTIECFRSKDFKNISLEDISNPKEMISTGNRNYLIFVFFIPFSLISFMFPLFCSCFAIINKYLDYAHGTIIHQRVSNIAIPLGQLIEPPNEIIVQIGVPI